MLQRSFSDQFPFNQRPVPFRSRPILERRIHPFQTFRGTCKKYHARGGAVQTVNHATKHISRLVVLFLQVGFDPIRQGYIAGFIALNEVSSRLVDRNKMVVLIEDVESLGQFLAWIAFIFVREIYILHVLNILAYGSSDVFVQVEVTAKETRMELVGHTD